MAYVLAQPATELFENLAQSTQMIRAKLKNDVNTPIAVMIRIGLIERLGVIGEYIGKIYLEAKERPRYIIGERTYDENE